MADLRNWSNKNSRQEDPVPQDELDPNEVDPMAAGGASRTAGQLENIVFLVRKHLPEIEEQIQNMEPVVLLSDDQELPEEDSDQLLELLDQWDDGLPELLSGIAPDDTITVAEQVQEDIQEVDPMLVAAWLWRAGELT